MKKKAALTVAVCFSLSILGILRVVCAEEKFDWSISERKIELFAACERIVIQNGVWEPMVFGERGSHLSIRSEIEEKYRVFFLWEIKEVKQLTDTAEVKRVEVIYSVAELDGENWLVNPDIDVILTAEIRKGLPCLFLKTRLRNINIDAINVTQWAWAAWANHPVYSVECYTSSDGVVKETVDEWGVFRFKDWLFVQADRQSSEGLGIIPEKTHDIGHSPDGIVIIHGERGMLEKGKFKEMDFIVVPIREGARQVEDIYMEIKLSEELKRK